jgi:AAA family ATP:ADP antiporter
VILDAMIASPGPAGARERLEAARVLAIVPESFLDLLVTLIGDADVDVARQAISAARPITRDELRPALMAALARPELSYDAGRALARFGNALVPELEQRLHDDAVPVEIKRELPAVLVRIGTPLAQQALIDALLQADVTLRHRVLISLNKLHDLHRDVVVDPHIVELLLAAEIGGHYRSYQVLGPLRARLKDDDSVLQGLHHAMEQELERIFRLMALLFDGPALHDAYVGVRSSNPIVRANALEFLDNVLKPELRRLLVPLLDSQVSVDERIAIANRLVGAPLETAEQAVATLLASEDSWLRSCAVYAVGALRLHGLEGELRRFEAAADPVLRQSVQVALHRLAGESETAQHRALPAETAIGVG